MIAPRAPRGWVFDMQRFALHDGPGIRTTVFLKGCPLRCAWCHNPEGLDRRPQLRLHEQRCTRCGRCATACPRGVHEVDAREHRLRIGECIRCGRCVAACPAAALEMVGARMSVEQVMAVVRRDVPFYRQSGGGMTLSGGEPLAQPAFARALLAAARAEEIPTAVETALAHPWQRVETLIPLVDLFLVDLKHTDNAAHRALTGAGNARILANLRRLAHTGRPLRLRIPWVPSRNADDAFLHGLEALLADLTPAPPVDILPYHRLGTGKWHALGLTPPMAEETPAATAEQAASWAERLRARGITVKVW